MQRVLSTPGAHSCFGDLVLATLMEKMAQMVNQCSLLNTRNGKTV